MPVLSEEFGWNLLLQVILLHSFDHCAGVPLCVAQNHRPAVVKPF
jgi:hypothetical protein